MSFDAYGQPGKGIHEPTVYSSTRVSLDSIWDRDERELAKVGKKSVLKRNFALMSVLGFSCSIMITWEGSLVVFTYGLNNGGPAGLIYQFLFTWLGYAAVVLSLSELVSMAPTSGGQYHWTYMLSPRSVRNFLSYIVGWQTIIAWQATVASACYLAAGIVKGLAILDYPEYGDSQQLWHATLLTMAICILALGFNTVLARLLPQIENAILVLHIAGFVVTLIVVAVMAPVKSSADLVFTEFLNTGGYQTQTLSFFVGTVGATYAFVGADGAVHMCEEIKNASTVVPWGLVGSIVINGVLGFLMIIVVLFCIGDIDAALNTSTGFPFLEIFQQATGTAGATGLGVILCSLFISATIACFAAASRMMWSFARDQGLPFSMYIMRVDSRTKIPLWAVFITCGVTLLLSLINIGSAEAFNAFVSLVISGFLGSYIIPFGLLLYRRLTDPKLEFGLWKMGAWGAWVNAFAIIWSIIAMFFSFWPGTIAELTLANMNWSCLVWGAANIFSVLFYFVHGRKVWTGPVIEIDGGMVLT
ncbi:putative choline transport protein [Aulographum hederae CBS 113979]|uniref:Putative choline transport protein n=1 Tax=Aulographum hederae CBS 113979 TaxID=1176131 RepID=A0A6G1HAM1_9PEZI|nr:putative choline transport protein [Aulographum hederae CBS 113979]